MELKSTLTKTGRPAPRIAGSVVPYQPVGAVDEGFSCTVESRNGESIVVAALQQRDVCVGAPVAEVRHSPQPAAIAADRIDSSNFKLAPRGQTC